MSGQEIKAAYFRLYGVSLDIGTIAARVNALCKDHELQRRAKSIKCPISGQSVYPIGLPIVQLELIN
jgi:hypothetical protein